MILDLIKELLTKEKTELLTTELNKTFGNTEPFQVILLDKEDKPLPDEKVNISIYGMTYEKTTDKDGIAKLNINLKPGTYNINCEYKGNNKYRSSKTYNKVIVKPVQQTTRMEGVNLRKTYGDTTPYQCAIYSLNTRVHETVEITIYGVTYTRKPDENGLCKLNINLKPGVYPLKAEFKGNDKYKGSFVHNTVEIIEKKEETTTPGKDGCYWSPRYYSSSAAKQDTAYNCGPNIIQQIVYELTGKFYTEKYISHLAGTTSQGTGHAGITKALQNIARELGISINIEWKHKSSISWEEIGKLIKKSNVSVGLHLMYKSKYGHYEYPCAVCPKKELVFVVNSLKGDTIVARSYATMNSWIYLISQPSLLIVTNLESVTFRNVLDGKKNPILKQEK